MRRRICEEFSGCASLSVFRFLVILLLGYAGFLRVNKLQSLRVQDVAMFAEHMSISIKERKND